METRGIQRSLSMESRLKLCFDCVDLPKLGRRCKNTCASNSKKKDGFVANLLPVAGLRGNYKIILPLPGTRY